MRPFVLKFMTVRCSDDNGSETMPSRAGDDERERDSSQQWLFSNKLMYVRATLTRTPPASLGHSDVPQPDTEVR